MHHRNSYKKTDLFRTFISLFTILYWRYHSSSIRFFPTVPKYYCLCQEMVRYCSILGCSRCWTCRSFHFDFEIGNPEYINSKNEGYKIYNRFLNMLNFFQFSVLWNWFTCCCCACCAASMAKLHWKYAIFNKYFLKK